MIAPVTDAQVEALLGHVGAVRVVPLEEAGAMLADDRRDLARGVPAGGRVARDAGVLRRTAQLVDALAALSRENVT